jgi:hypothetical protein
LDLTIEPLSTINQRLLNSPISTPSRSASLSSIATFKKSELPIPQTSQSIPMNTYQQPIIGDHRSRCNGPLTSTTNKMYLIPHLNSYHEHLSQTNINTQKPSERGRIFVHHSDSRQFVLGEAIQMKPIDNLIALNDKRRPCHRQNALRYKSNEQERQSRTSEPVIMHHNPTHSSRYQSIERRLTPSPRPMKSLPCDFNNPSSSFDNSLSVREKAKLFEHKLSTGRENYV